MFNTYFSIDKLSGLCPLYPIDVSLLCFRCVSVCYWWCNTDVSVPGPPWVKHTCVHSLQTLLFKPCYWKYLQMGETNSQPLLWKPNHSQIFHITYPTLPFHFENLLLCFSGYRTQVYLGSDLWVRVSLTNWATCADLSSYTSYKILTSYTGCL